MNDYIETNLDCDEIVIECAGRHKLPLFVSVFVPALFILLPVIYESTAFANPFLVIMLFFGLAGSGFEVLNFFFTKLAFTNKRLLGTSGVIFKQRIDIPLEKAADFKINRGFFGKKFGYGIIILLTADETEVFFNFISDPETFKNNILDQLKKGESICRNQE